MKDSESIKIYFDQLYEISSLTEEEEKKLFRQIKKGGKRSEKARLKVIESNLPLVVSLAKKYYYPAMNLEFLNFIEEGNIGLVKAVNKYDISKGFKFSTYASWWIEKYFQSVALKARNIIKIPEKTWITLKRIEKTTAKLLQKTGYTPNIKTLSQKINMSINELRNLLESTFKVKNVGSLDFYLDENKIHSIGETVSQEGFSMDTMINKISEKERLQKLMANLTTNEQEVIKLRFGLIDGRKHPYEEIGKKLGISSVKAKDMQEIAIRKLRRIALE